MNIFGHGSARNLSIKASLSDRYTGLCPRPWGQPIHFAACSDLRGRLSQPALVGLSHAVGGPAWPDPLQVSQPDPWLLLLTDDEPRDRAPSVAWTSGRSLGFGRWTGAKPQPRRQYGVLVEPRVRLIRYGSRHQVQTDLCAGRRSPITHPLRASRAMRNGATDMKGL